MSETRICSYCDRERSEEEFRTRNQCWVCYRKRKSEAEKAKRRKAKREELCSECGIMPTADGFDMCPTCQEYKRTDKRAERARSGDTH